jgi:preprotein translocase subunit SecE
MARTADTFWDSIFSINLYKKNQGKLVRGVTLAAVFLAVALGAWTMSTRLLVDLPTGASAGSLAGLYSALQVGLPLLVTAVGFWLGFRLMHYPKFADFLVDVEGEMTKVSWSTFDELKRATVVVVITMLLLGGVLFFYDLFWQWLLRALNVLQF